MAWLDHRRNINIDISRVAVKLSVVALAATVLAGLRQAEWLVAIKQARSDGIHLFLKAATWFRIRLKLGGANFPGIKPTNKKMMIFKLSCPNRCNKRCICLCKSSPVCTHTHSPGDKVCVSGLWVCRDDAFPKISLIANLLTVVAGKPAGQRDRYLVIFTVSCYYLWCLIRPPV